MFCLVELERITRKEFLSIFKARTATRFWLPDNNDFSLKDSLKRKRFKRQRFGILVMKPFMKKLKSQIIWLLTLNYNYSNN